MVTHVEREDVNRLEGLRTGSVCGTPRSQS